MLTYYNNMIRIVGIPVGLIHVDKPQVTYEYIPSVPQLFPAPSQISFLVIMIAMSW